MRLPGAGEPLGISNLDNDSAENETVRDILRRLLADSTLDLVYPRVGTGGWIDGLGVGTTSIAVAGRAFTTIDRSGQPVVGLIHDRALLDYPERLGKAIDTVTLALDNERLKAQLQSQMAEVGAAHARSVEAADRERRRIERNLHDGAQQRMVGLALTLRMASRRLEGNPEVGELLADAASELDEAIRDLRALARGIHPAIVEDAGLVGAFESLAEGAGVPVELVVDLPQRLPQPVEVAAYYFVAETLTNVRKHAAASLATVRAFVDVGVLHLTVSDDGSGGAAPQSGSGLEGLADRLIAFGGALDIKSATGQGTLVSAAIPLAVAPDLERERRRFRVITWIGWENWQAPAELYEQITDEDNLTYGKSILLCVGGIAALSDRERSWLEGYLTTVGDADWVIEAIMTSDDSDTLEALRLQPGMDLIARALVYDALRLCASDGPLSLTELDRVHHAANVLGIGRDVVAALHQIVIEEHALQIRRGDLIMAPILARSPLVPNL
jgi:signal transduction histidine kinase